MFDKLLENVFKLVHTDETKKDSVEGNRSVFLANSTWKKIKGKVNKLYNEGSPPCIYAVKILGSILKEKGVPFVIVSGDYNGEGHWWIIAGSDDKKVLDLGNGIRKEAIETGEIEPIIINYKESEKEGYRPEDTLSYEQFIRYYKKLI